MTTPLNRRDYLLLRALVEVGGFKTRDACRRAGLETGRRDTALAHQEMLHLQKLGFVRQLDNQKPIAWVRTRAGTERANEPIWNTPYGP